MDDPERAGYVYVSMQDLNGAGPGVPQSRSCIRRFRGMSRFQRSLLYALILIGASGLLLAIHSYRTQQPQKPDFQPVQESRTIFDKLRVTISTLADSVIGITHAPTPPPPQASQSVRLELETFGQQPRLEKPRPLTFKGPQNARQEAVVEAFLHAWNGYKEYAWGHDHLKTLGKGGQDWFGLGLTILDSLDTLYIMNLQEEFLRARNWVADSLSFEVKKYVSLFETTIRCLGGLLSAYFLTGDDIFRIKAEDLGYRLAAGFSSPSGVPYSDVNLSTRKARAPAWSSDSSLSEVATLQLEFRALARVTGVSMFEDHLACFLSGTLALGYLHGLPAEHLDYAKELGHTCYQMYKRTKTGLAPEIAHFNMVPGSTKDDIIIKPLDSHYLLRPEAVESFFYLYRITGDVMYQDWGWSVLKAIQEYARTPVAFASVSNVKRTPVTLRDPMESFFLGETLKYLYLLFDSNTTAHELPLTQFVFNTEAHPLPIYQR